MPEVAVDAPDFSLHSSSFKEISLRSFRGQKNVVLVFFPAAFTGVCTKELCTFENELNQFNTHDTQVLGLTVDGPHPTGEFVKQNNISFRFCVMYIVRSLQNMMLYFMTSEFRDILLPHDQCLSSTNSERFDGNGMLPILV